MLQELGYGHICQAPSGHNPLTEKKESGTQTETQETDDVQNVSNVVVCIMFVTDYLQYYSACLCKTAKNAIPVELNSEYYNFRLLFAFLVDVKNLHAYIPDMRNL